MAYTTNKYLNKDNFTEGSTLACAVKITASRASASSKSVTITCESHLGFGSYADGTSYEGGTIYADCWYGGDTWATRTGGSYATVSTGGWYFTDGGTWSRLTTSDSNLTQYAYTPHKHNTFSFTISNWTSGAKTFYYLVEGPNVSPTLSVSLSCPTYYTSPSVSLSTASQSVKPGSSVVISWSGTNGTNNKISGYKLYYGGSNVYSGTAKTYTVTAPTVGASKDAYVTATGAYSNATSSTITITSEPYMWVGVGGAWKPVESVYILVNGVWKDADPDDPIDVGVSSAWKGV